MKTFFDLFLVSCIAIVLTIVFYLLERKTKFNKLPFMVRQVIIGVVFGAAAIFGTEKGVPITGAMLNARDAAPLAAGFFFGGPAGIIAGLIGGIERALAYIWNTGRYTVVACSVTTALAGFYAAFIRKFIFDDRRPSPLFCFCFTVIIEMFHMSMVYFTHTNDPETVLEVLKAATMPMVLANSLSVFGSASALLVIHYFLYKAPLIDIRKKPRISNIVQYALLGTIIVSFLGAYFTTYNVQTKINKENIVNTFDYTLSHSESDLFDASINALLADKQGIDDEYRSLISLKTIQEEHSLYDISIVNKDYQITESTNLEAIGKRIDTIDRFKSFKTIIDYGEDMFTYETDYLACPFNLTVLNRYVIFPCAHISNRYIMYSYTQQTMHEKVKDFARHYINQYITSTTTSFSIVETNTKEFVNTTVVFGQLTEDFRNKVATLLETTKIGNYLTTEINGKKVLLSYRNVEGFSVISSLDYNKVFLTRDLAVHVNADSIVLVFGILFIMTYLLMKYLVVRRIHSVNKSLNLITQGDLNEVVKENSTREFEALSTGINSTVETLKRYIAEAEARIDQELEFARTIQLSALPNNFPKVDEFEIYAHSIPAKEVGGDFYDFYYTEKGNLVIMIADVSGKGIPAAMFMMHAKTELKALGENDVTPKETFTRGNTAICEGNEANMFVTAWQANIDLSNGNVKFANAGHNPPILMRYGSDFEYIDNKKSLVLGVMDGIKYKDQELQLNPGDVLILYTDGVTEATNSNNELFGEQRFLDELNKCKDKPLKEIYNHMKAKILEFQGDAPQFDDITVLAFRYNGKKEEK